jgi:hypothetical protein
LARVWADDQALAFLLHRLGRDAGLAQRGADALLEGIVDLAAAVGGDLHGRVLLVHVGQRVQRADRQDDQDQEVLPAWEFKHCRFLRDTGPGAAS